MTNIIECLKIEIDGRERERERVKIKNEKMCMLITFSLSSFRLYLIVVTNDYGVTPIEYLPVFKSSVLVAPSCFSSVGFFSPGGVGECFGKSL